jgi:hypothetical protein
MPITQQSQIDLLEAALDWRFAFTEARRLMKSAYESGDHERLHFLLLREDYDFLQHPVLTESTIARTEEHIRHTRRYNEWRRKKYAPPTIEDPELLIAARAAGFTTVAAWKDSIFERTQEPVQKNPSQAEKEAEEGNA